MYVYVDGKKDSLDTFDTDKEAARVYEPFAKL
jgi:hypothetical protein